MQDTALDPRDEHKITRNRVLSSSIQELWERQSRRFDASRQRINDCRAMRRNEKLFKLPDEFKVPGAENLVISLPQKITVPLKTVNVLSRKAPRLQRFAVGSRLNAELMASNIETWANAAIEKRLKWGRLIGGLFDDGECAIIVCPSLANWAKSPDFMDSLDEHEFGMLDEETQERYARVNEYDEPIIEDDTEDEGEEALGRKKRNPAAASGEIRYVRVDDDGEPQVNPRYLRDSGGRAPDDPYYTDNPRRKFKQHAGNTRKAFEEEQAHWLAEELPFKISIISPTECAPIFGEEDELIGLIVRRTFSREFLLSRDYVWDDDAELLQQEPDDSGEVVLFEFWGTDRDGVPYVSYSVNGTETRFRREGPAGAEDLCDAVVDLRKEFGLRKLPILYAWGLHFETDDYKHKGVPFLWPVLGAITGVEALSTSVLVHSYATAFGSWGVAADPQIFNAHPQVFTEGGRPRNIRFAPLTTTILPGRPYPLVHPGVGKDVKDLLNMLMQSASAMAPADSIFGGAGATSGHDRALSREYLETSMNQVLDGALQAYRFIGERILEICCCITKRTGVPVPVYATVPVPQITGDASKSRQQKQIVELRPDWVGPIYNLSAFYPQTAGENLAELQQLAQLLLQGLVTFREFREKGFGDENPAATLIEIFCDQYLRSDAGKTEIAQLAAEYMGADSQDEKQKLMDQKRLTADGTPMAALPPELQALNTGQIPPGVDPELFLTKLQGMLAHDAARNVLKGSGPVGPGGSPAMPAGVPPMAPGAAELAGAPGANIPPSMTPAGAPGPAGPGPGGLNEKAPGLPGMSIPNQAAQSLGGTVAGEVGRAASNRDELRQ